MLDNDRPGALPSIVSPAPTLPVSIPVFESPMPRPAASVTPTISRSISSASAVPAFTNPGIVSTATYGASTSMRPSPRASRSAPPPVMASGKSSWEPTNSKARTWHSRWPPGRDTQHHHHASATGAVRTPRSQWQRNLCAVERTSTQTAVTKYRTGRPLTRGYEPAWKVRGGTRPDFTIRSDNTTSGDWCYGAKDRRILPKAKRPRWLENSQAGNPKPKKLKIPDSLWQTDG